MTVSNSENLRSLAVRLAKAEFARMSQELDRMILEPPAFRKDRLDQGDHFQSFHLPPLPVPLGLIAYSETPDNLPVIGIDVPSAHDARCLLALAGLLGSHHSAPFAKLLFVVRSLELIPFLGRYGFAVVRWPEATSDPGEFFSYLEKKFQMGQLRSLVGAEEIWRLSNKL